MRTERRWIASVTREAARIEFDMPWTRGARRAEWIARRNGTPGSMTDCRAASA